MSTPDTEKPAASDATAQGWSAPEPSRPRASELVIAAVMVTLLAGLVFWGSAAVEGEPVVVLGQVEPARALDASAVPSGAFVTVSGRPDGTRAVPLYAMGPGRGEGALLVLREEPRLVLRCRGDHPLAEVLRRHRTLPGGTTLPVRELEEVWTFAGRIHDAKDYSDPEIGASGVSVQQFAAEKLGVKDGEAVRVLAVGTTPADLRRSARTALFFAVGMTLVAIVLWTLAIHSIVQNRREHEVKNEAP
ncbi:MAG: hypothetical protein FJ291_05680 [Planctomycetes bacterium]|nr:hypothetical protein [Planctomycetota bacterium]